MLMEIAQSAHRQENIGEERWFLADHTNGRAYATVLRPSVVVCRRRLWRYVLWLNGAY